MHQKNSITKQYQSLSIQTASPGKLILMLFEGALRFLKSAQNAFTEEEIAPSRRNEAIHNNITKTNQILLELQTSLNKEKGGQFAETMSNLYTYMMEQLTQSNIKKEASYLQEVEKILLQLRDAWAEMLQNSEHLPTMTNQDHIFSKKA